MKEIFKEACVLDKQSGEVITSKHAILIDHVHDFSYGDYLHAVGDCVGPGNICSIGKCNGKIKIYLSYLTQTKSIVSSGIQIDGRQLTVDYNDPDGTKLLLLNVQTEIPNSILEEKLSSIGEVVSNITTMAIDIPDPDYAHVLSDTRSVHVKIDPQTTIPRSLEIAHGGKQFEILIQQDSAETNELHYPKQYPEQNFHMLIHKDSLMNSSSSTVVASRKRGRPPYKHLKENAVESSIDPPTKKRQQVKRKVLQKRRRYAHLRLPVKAKYGRKKVDSTSSKSVLNGEKQEKEVFTDISNTGIVNESDGLIFEGNSSKLPQDRLSMESQSANNGKVVPVYDIDSEVVVSDDGDAIPFQIIPEHPFDLQSLLDFLKEAKNNRNPFELANKMLEDNNTPGQVNYLCDQLIEYYKYVKETSLKSRIYRLVQLLSCGHKEAV